MPHCIISDQLFNSKQYIFNSQHYNYKRKQNNIWKILQYKFNNIPVGPIHHEKKKESLTNQVVIRGNHFNQRKSDKGEDSLDQLKINKKRKSDKEENPYDQLKFYKKRKSDN